MASLARLARLENIILCQDPSRKMCNAPSAQPGDFKIRLGRLRVPNVLLGSSQRQRRSLVDHANPANTPTQRPKNVSHVNEGGTRPCLRRTSASSARADHSPRLKRQPQRAASAKLAECRRTRKGRTAVPKAARRAIRANIRWPWVKQRALTVPKTNTLLKKRVSYAATAKRTSGRGLDLVRDPPRAGFASRSFS